MVAYRLRSDDLELMEREVYEELRVKKEVQRFQERAKRVDHLAAVTQEVDTVHVEERL